MLKCLFSQSKRLGWNPVVIRGTSNPNSAHSEDKKAMLWVLAELSLRTCVALSPLSTGWYPVGLNSLMRLMNDRNVQYQWMHVSTHWLNVRISSRVSRIPCDLNSLAALSWCGHVGFYTYSRIQSVRLIFFTICVVYHKLGFGLFLASSGFKDVQKGLHRYVDNTKLCKKNGC